MPRGVGFCRVKRPRPELAHIACSADTAMSTLKNWKESLLPQPPSFSKKKTYEIHQVLGTGTFGKVMVRQI
jgi:hypothetical protein